MKIRYYGQIMFDLGIMWLSIQGVNSMKLRYHLMDQINRVLNNLADMIGDGDIPDGKK